MTRIAIFLRGINLGRRRLSGDDLKRPFLAAGFTGVGTFIASGNVVIDDPGLSPKEIETRVEAEVHTAFGFEADAFVRTVRELAELAAKPQVTAGEEEGFTPHAIFLKEAPTAEALNALEALESEEDRFPVLGREVVWLRRGRLTDSPVEPRHLEKALGNVPNTMRKLTTIRRMAAKFGA